MVVREEATGESTAVVMTGLIRSDVRLVPHIHIELADRVGHKGSGGRDPVATLCETGSIHVEGGLMKFAAALCCSLGLLSATAMAQTPAPDPVGGPFLHAEPAVELFKCVKYKDLCEMAPCHVKKVIQVRNPCKRCCTDPECVNIEICVPETCPCDDEPCVLSLFGGRRVRYDYGKYEVDVRVKRGYIEVDYQD